MTGGTTQGTIAPATWRYNEPGYTYNEPGVIYGGFYGLSDGLKPVMGGYFNPHEVRFEQFLLTESESFLMTESGDYLIA